jgi:hypothetical protein
VKARARAILPGSRLTEGRELSHAAHQKQIEWGKPERNHRRNQLIMGLTTMTFLLFVAFAGGLLVLEQLHFE